LAHTANAITCHDAVVGTVSCALTTNPPSIRTARRIATLDGRPLEAWMRKPPPIDWRPPWHAVDTCLGEVELNGVAVLATHHEVAALPQLIDAAHHLGVGVGGRDQLAPRGDGGGESQPTGGVDQRRVEGASR
jgi:hypothetical protein